MKVLHTSDWHLGKRLYERSRHEEHEAFLRWLTELIETERVDLLLVAGDIFDSSTPKTEAIKLYYDFIARLPRFCKAVVTAGNHDSPLMLESSSELMQALDVRVVSRPGEKEIIVMRDEEDRPVAVVCAVPYLRSSDLKGMTDVEAGEWDNRIVGMTESHYREVGEKAEEIRNQSDCASQIPIIGMGHLYCMGGRMAEGDGVREIYVGNIAGVEDRIFPECMDYVALGHLHVPQRVGDSDRIRYCGSPLPIGFGECGQQKYVNLLEFTGRNHVLREIEIPVFRELYQIGGDIEDIFGGLDRYRDRKAWLEIRYEGECHRPTLKEDCEAYNKGSESEILCLLNPKAHAVRLTGEDFSDELKNLDPDRVFEKYLEKHNVSEEDRAELWSVYREAEREMSENA